MPETFTTLLPTVFSQTVSSLTSSVVPRLYPVAIGGHPYLIDFEAEKVRHASIPILRDAAVTADEDLGEKNLNPESLWRSSQNTWHKGAGQSHRDRPDSVPERFRSSKNINVWERNQITLLPATESRLESAETNLRLAVAGNYLYVIDGQELKFTQDLSSWTTVTDTPAADATCITSDGYSIYVGYTGDGVYVTTRGAAAASQLVTDAVTPQAIGYVKGRLMLAVDEDLFNITSASAAALPTALFTHPNSDFRWVGFAEGNSALYALGYSGDKTTLYRIGIKTDGSGLDVPIQALRLPDGEIGTGLGEYPGGFLAVGTTAGVHFCQTTQGGDAEMGPLIETGTAVRAFEHQSRFIWFGWENYDATSTGLGRLNLQFFNDTLQPAYASDLMATAQGEVLSIVTFDDKRVFTVSGVGVFEESDALAETGTIDCGLISWQLPDNKVGMYLRVKHLQPLWGSLSAYISVDGGSFALLGTRVDTTSQLDFGVGERVGETFEVRHVLARDADDPMSGPTISRHTLLAQPVVDTGYVISVPLKLHQELDIGNRTTVHLDVPAEVAYLKGLRDAGSRVIYQEGTAAYSVTVKDLEWVAFQPSADGTCLEGTCLVRMKTV